MRTRETKEEEEEERKNGFFGVEAREAIAAI